jgi:hypothetical protein
VTTQISRDSNAVHPLTSFETDIVVDLGCCSYQHGNKLEDSIQTLVKRFKPGILFGFDPHPALTEGVGKVHGTTVITSRRAAWTSDGDLGLTVNGNCTHIDADERETVRTFDFAAWVRALPDVNIVLKIDAEGAEYVLLPHLIEQGLMDRFSRLLVEWHKGKRANGYETDRATILEGIPSIVEEWA